MTDPTRREDPASLDPTRRETPDGATRRENTTGTSGSSWDHGLPADLAARFEVVQAFDAGGNEADAYLVRGQDGLLFAKVYRRGIKPNSEVLRRLNGAAPEHVIRLVEAGTSANQRDYELLEYAERGTLRDLMSTEGPQLDLRLVRAILEEILSALEHVHTLDIEHRDIKPDNMLVRNRQPLDLVLTDFGISSALDATQRFTSRNRTARYSPPEALDGVLIRTRWDCWSLGIMLVEMVAGRHPFEGQGDQAISHRLISRPTDELVEEITDQSWRLLCRGLLRRDPAVRWGTLEVRKWLANARDSSLVVVDEGGRGRPPFRFLGREFETCSELAGGFASNWNEALRVWKSRQSDLLNWLRDDLGEVAKAKTLEKIDLQANASEHQQMFLVLQVLAPGEPLSFSERALTAESVCAASEEAARGDKSATEWLFALHEHNILALVDPSVPGSDLLRATHAAWNGEIAEFTRLLATIPGGGEMGEGHIKLLLAPATPTSSALELLREQAKAASTPSARSRLWFENLGSTAVAGPGRLLVMLVAAPSAEAEIDSATEARRRSLTQLWGYVGAGLVVGLVVGAVWWGLVDDYCSNPGANAVCNAGWPHPALRTVDVVFLGGAITAAVGMLGAVNSKIAGRR